MSSLRHESHVAQQIRRDKLRIPSSEDFPNNLEQLSLQQGLSSDNFRQLRNARNVNMLYEPAYYSSEVVSFSSPVTAHKDSLGYQDLGATESSSLMVTHYAPDHPASSSIHSLPKEQCEPRNLGNWRNSGLSQGSDWVVDYANSSVVNESNIPNSVFVPELNNVADNQQFVKPGYNELTDVRCSLSNPSSQMASRENQGQIGEMKHSHSPSFYQNTLQDVVKAASVSAQVSDMASSLMQETGHGGWMGNGNSNELVLLLPSYTNQSNPLRFGNANSWASRDEDSGQLLSDSYPQGLSLSLSSNAQQSSLSASQFGSDDLQSRNAKPVKSIIKPSIISRDSGKSLQDIIGIPSNASYRNVGPLGPFTGYATILKSSRFLKPAQQLLDEICCVSGSYLNDSTSADVGNGPESGICSKGSSSSMFNGSRESGGSIGGGNRPEYQQKKAKLLYMQEEVGRRYKQYHQQMQMVVSSFESVSVLNSATPYISLALRTVSRHFRGLKNAISDQLKQIKEMLGEDMMSAPSTTGTSSKLDPNIARLRYMDQGIQKNKSVGGNVGFLESHQQAWRPQRGLPERSVAILRAWLFEHFLHPYPTDTDKHMLATQTGLSRNQVSNWFINARVRVWKPMVEEIHMLETKGLTAANQNSSKDEGTSGTEGTSQPRLEQPQKNNYETHAIPDKQLECFEMGSFNNTGNVEEQWNQEKRSKLECQISSSIDGTLMGFVPYQRAGVEVGGLASVSLTLGLRHGVEGSQHQQQQLQQENQLRPHFGGHIVHDFAG